MTTETTNTSTIKQIAKIFDAHVYTTVRVKIADIHANSPSHAAELAESAVLNHPSEWLRGILGQVEISDLGPRKIIAVEPAHEVTATLIDRHTGDGRIVESLFDRAKEFAAASMDQRSFESMLDKRNDLRAFLAPYLSSAGMTRFGIVSRTLKPVEGSHEYVPKAVEIGLLTQVAGDVGGAETIFDWFAAMRAAASPLKGANASSEDVKGKASEWMAALTSGTEVWFNDPDHGKSSGLYKIDSVDVEEGESIVESTLIRLVNLDRGEAEVYAHELTPSRPAGLLPVVVKDLGAWTHAGYAHDADTALGAAADFHRRDVNFHATEIEAVASSDSMWVATLDPAVRVTNPSGKPDVWCITQNITDRWGDINKHDAQYKAFEELAGNPSMVEILRSQMWGETTFIVRKDGAMGILFEVEYCSQQSESNFAEHKDVNVKHYADHSDVVAGLLAGLNAIQADYPNIDMCVPDCAEIACGRPAVWAFVPNGLLREVQRQDLGRRLIAL